MFVTYIKTFMLPKVNFEAGTYNVHANPVTIEGNAKINGSTFDLRRDLILNGNVEFSGNITFNVTGGYSVFFQNNLPSVLAGTSIEINVNGAHPVDAVSALSIFRVNGGAFVPEGHNYNPVTGKMNFRNKQDKQRLKK
ncbi:hypothetical protein REIP_0342 [Rickettsia endosymbiont of Ixodes pacificus]|nr:hypothetical protein [Rickettsia endosymbiont of Ixodes pacificus]KJW02336.1 hypothetical protein REIP_0342 [Rickettsia endosymbiont of Ixodes pacificus]